MKDRIEELWAEHWDNETQLMSESRFRGAATELLNEALELAAREAERYEPDEKTSYVNYASQAIRKLKVE